jgi:hypothetical protein
LAWQKAHYVKKSKVPGSCPHCGEIFWGKPDKKFCSIGCRTESYYAINGQKIRERNRAFYHGYMKEHESEIKARQKAWYQANKDAIKARREKRNSK